LDCRPLGRGASPPAQRIGDLALEARITERPAAVRRTAQLVNEAGIARVAGGRFAGRMVRLPK